FLKELYHRWERHWLGDTAAALTYYGMLSVFPFLIFLTTFMGLLLDRRAITQIVGEAAKVVPGPVVAIINDRLTSLQQTANSGLFTFGILGSLWIASGAVDSLTQALNRCYGVPETRPYWRSRGLAIVVTVAAGIVSVFAGAVMLFVPFLGQMIANP